MALKNKGYLNQQMYCFFLLLLFLTMTCLGPVPVKCRELFKTQTFGMPDRTLAVIPADLDNNGISEIITVRKTGVYPLERRWIIIYAVNTDFKFNLTPQQEWEIDKDAVMFEVGDVTGLNGKEIFFLTSNGIRYFARQDDGRYSTSSRSLINTPTAAVFPAHGSLPRTKLFSDWHGRGQKMLLLPKFGTLYFYGKNQTGKWFAAEKISITPRTYLYSNQNDDGILRSFSMRMDYRFPNIFTQDFNGDGYTDLLLTEQETICVYPSQSDGSFSQKPYNTFTLPGRSNGRKTDENRSFHIIPSDINNDGFTDVILTLGQDGGGFLERKADVSIFLNQKDPNTPFAAHPDQTITFYGITPGICLLDINKDGVKDLLFSNIKLGFWNTVKNLISKQVIVYTSVYIFQKNQKFKEVPDFSNTTKYHLDLTQGIQFKGFWPSIEGDFNGDGYPDLLIVADGKVRIYQTRQDQTLFSKSYHQEDILTFPFRQITDINGDGLDDLIMYEKKWDAKITILINSGNWLKSSKYENHFGTMDR